jgi:hypothetical protein
VAYGFCLRQPTQFPQGPISSILAMTLASCNDLNITKSERHVESAFRLVEPSCESYSDVGRVATELGFDYVLGAKSTIIKRAIGMCPPSSKLITSPYASGRTHRVESRTHSLSEVRTERNIAAPHAAEIAVASHRAAEIE